MLDTFWASLIDPKDPLMGMRQKYWDQFQKVGLPRGKVEAFQYVNKNFNFPPLATWEEKRHESVEGLLFVDGFFDVNGSTFAEPLVCLPIEVANKSYGLFLQGRFSKFMKEEDDPFALLNGAFQGRGAFLYVPPKCKAALHLHQKYTSTGFISPRLHVYLGRGAEFELTQKSTGECISSNAMIDFVLDSGASLKFSDHATGHFQSIRASLKRDAKFKYVSVGKKTRVSMKVELLEENSEVHLLGLAKLSKTEESHFHVTVEHIAPNARSRQHFKSVLEDRAKFSFEGKIHVRSEAQKTESYQLNNNLVLSDEATAYAKPNLEIFADDVKASHGATMGKLDSEELFYLRSRGLSLEDAKRFLVEGFLKEISDHA